MKTLKFIIIIVLFLSFPFFALSQPIEVMKPKKARTPCLSSREINLTQEQLKGIRIAQQEYLRDIRLLRIELLSKRMELREFLKNPQINTESLREKCNEITDLQSKLNIKTLEYLIKIRSIFTQEQLQKWCPEFEIPFFQEMMPHRMGPMHMGSPNE